jgi:osmotically-inducible protein OsmY
MGTYGYGERGRFTGRGPRGYQRSDERIREDINERLTEHPEIDASDIEVQVKGGEVTLTGTVDRRQTKRMAEDLCENVSGVKEVHNQLRVGEYKQETASTHSQPAGGAARNR